MPLNYKALGKSYLLIKTRKILHLISVHLHNISLTPIFLALLIKDMPYQGKSILSSSKVEKKMIHCFHTLKMLPMFR